MGPISSSHVSLIDIFALSSDSSILFPLFLHNYMHQCDGPSIFPYLKREIVSTIELSVTSIFVEIKKQLVNTCCEIAHVIYSS